MSDFPPLQSFAGNVGTPPESFTTQKGEATKFSLALTQYYRQRGEEDYPPAKWLNVTVFNEGLQELVQEKIHKGQNVAVEGNYKEREYNGKVYYDLVAHRVGLVQWLDTRSQRRQDDDDI